MTEDGKRLDRWEVVMWSGVWVAVVAIVWLALTLAFGSSQALTWPATLGLAGALTAGVGVFGPLVAARRGIRSSDRMEEGT